MTRISEKFKRLKSLHQKALITYVTAGDPTLAFTEKLIYELERSGADIIELGVPFSDPLADGPTIQASHMRALKNDVSVASVIELVKKVRAKTNIPIILMLSFNLVFHYGTQKFVSDSLDAGVDGVIPPDLSHDEATSFVNEAKGLDTIFLVAPTSTDERIQDIVKDSTGFVYLVSLTGITGEGRGLPEDIKNNVSRIKRYTGKPVAVGFGISTPAQVKEICNLADGAIVGSAIVKVIEQNIGKVGALRKVGTFVEKLKSGTVCQKSPV